MKLIPGIFLSSLFLASCSSSAPEAKLAGSDVSTAQMATGLNEFTLELYDAVATSGKFQGQNVFISPASVSTAFGMTYLGARHETAAELARVLHYPGRPEEIGPAFKGLLSGLSAKKDTDGFELSIANRIWGQ